MAGCSKEVVTKSEVSADDAWMYDETLPVPVEFGVSSVRSKAAIETSADLNGKSFKVFAFDKNTHDYTKPDGLNLRNADAKCQLNQGKSVLTLKKLYYYPQYLDTEYCFYSFYPVATTTIDSQKVLVDMPVSGTYDVLWAKSIVNDGGYNAEYFRDGNPLPSFNYSHPCACVSLSASLSQSISEKIIIDGVKLINVPLSAKLCVATCEDVSYEDEGYFVEVTQKGDKALTNGSSGNLSVELTTSPKRLGVDLFLVPCSSLTLQVTMRINGVVSKAPVEYVLNPSDFRPELKGFEAGVRYEFNLNVLSPTQLQVTVQGVDDYTSAFGGGSYNPDKYKD